MSEEIRDRTIPSAPLSGWTLDQIKKQAYELAMRVVQERFAQEERWGPQELPMLKNRSDGKNETGRPYRQWEAIFKFQCDRNRADDNRAMDVVLLEEVFEALAALVELADTLPLTDGRDRALREEAKKHAVIELIQVAAVAVKMAGIIERTD
jgi:hypothetical protein